MREIGAVVRLQIQRSSLKTGEKPHRVYDPSPVLAVRRLAVGGDGVLGEGENRSWIVDVHHRAHPQTKNPDGMHGVSVGFTSHYDAMRQRFSDRITLGCAGENIIVETSRRFTLEDLAAGLVCVGAGGSEVTRLAAHDAPALGRVIADLEKPAVDGNVAAIHVEHNDVTGGDAHDGVPGAAAQQVSARSAHARPSLGLNPSGSDVAGRHALMANVQSHKVS